MLRLAVPSKPSRSWTSRCPRFPPPDRAVSRPERRTLAPSVTIAACSMSKAPPSLVPSRRLRTTSSTSTTPSSPAARRLNFRSVLGSVHDLLCSVLLCLANGFPTAANGVPANPQARASPAPQPPNGKLAPTVVDTLGGTPPSDSQRPAPSASDSRNIVRRKLTGYVGFANLPNQWHRKSVRKGFNFNVMVVGQYLAPEAPAFLAPDPFGPQVNLVWESRRSSTRCSTRPCTPPRSARGRASTSFPRPSPFSPSAPISRKPASVCG